MAQLRINHIAWNGECVYITIDINQNQVLASTATTMANNWFTSTQEGAGNMEAQYFEQSMTQDVRDRLNKQWHVRNSYAFHQDRTAAANVTKGISDAGYFTNFTPFVWNPTDTASERINNEGNHWVKGSEVVLYSPHGQPLMERDALNIPSTVHFGYNEQLPSLVAANASYENVFFNDYEDVECLTCPAHSGRSALHMNSAGSSGTNSVSENLPGLVLDQQLMSEGGIVRVWLRSEFPAIGTTLNTPDLDNNSHNFRVHTGVETKPLTRVARTGEWDLYEAYLYFNNGGYSINSPLNLTLEYDRLNTSERVYIDDLRFQPRESQVTCYVYNPDNFRLLTEFGDQHFGVYYQYDLEGKLVRQMIETERGMKTLKETQYNVPRQNRSN